jgi:ribosome-binding protein aMBF1 (putative translation factor)
MTVWNIFQVEFTDAGTGAFHRHMRDDIHSTEHRRLREILKRYRLAAGLRQADLAAQTGRSQAYISKFENGDLRLDMVDFVLLCRTIGADPHLVLDEVFKSS